MKNPLRSLGPAIVVAAVVCGPGSILTASKTGAIHGYSMTWLLALAVVLMIGTASLAARLGATLDGTPCDEIARRLNRPLAAAIGIVVFLIAAGFQTSNNLAVIKAITSQAGGQWSAAIVVIALNAALLFIVYRSRSLYAPVEKAMKLLVGLMVLAFVANCIATRPSITAAIGGLVPRLPDGNQLALMGLVATTFSIAGAFYQAYLVRDKGWGAADLKRTFADSAIGMLMLGGITLIIMLSAAATLQGKPIATIADVSKAIEELFGAWAGVVLAIGIVAGALSSFLVNAMIGGRLFADGFGKGATTESPWSRHGTALALVAGLAGGLVAHFTAGDDGKGNITPIIIAQASTVLGGPALAMTLLYLGSRRDTKGGRAPAWMLAITGIGFLVTLVLAWRTGTSLLNR